jgi:dihydropyrimidine dehydrogenase (NAD+) subunit PreT
VIVDPKTMQTSNPKYFAGGDCVNGGGEVVDAVAHGKRAARGMHAALESKTKGVAHA